MLNMRHIQTICRPARRANRRQTQRRNQITPNSVELVDTFRLVYATVQIRREVLCEANERLNVHEDVEDESEDRVGRGEVFVAGACFVHLDDDQTGSQC